MKETVLTANLVSTNLLKKRKHNDSLHDFWKSKGRKQIWPYMEPFSKWRQKHWIPWDHVAKKWCRFDETNCGGPIKFGLEDMWKFAHQIVIMTGLHKVFTWSHKTDAWVCLQLWRQTNGRQKPNKRSRLKVTV